MTGNQASKFASQLEPYKRVLGVLLRPTCVSIAVSNEYQSLAQPVGAVLLRGGRVPQRVLQKMLEPHGGELTGIVWGCEGLSEQQVKSSEDRTATLEEIKGVVAKVRPGLRAVWWDGWSADTPPSCRILPPGGPSQASATLNSAPPAPPAQSAQSSQQQHCRQQQQVLQQQQGVGKEVKAAVQVLRTPSKQGPSAPWARCSCSTSWILWAHRTRLGDTTGWWSLSAIARTQRTSWFASLHGMSMMAAGSVDTEEIRRAVMPMCVLDDLDHMATAQWVVSDPSTVVSM
eukprot:CAMPEP_0202861548 /NCGR_PEP_ID=MMETSP1391-20130828/2911_1 /ASSEMBLY_ACC=CAM_ASM_000867 /TAXON_ID=1034604 /ORGANISM="Chlamydomonas leiostraca, Strain SAG 11-49" /LENGTH=286 /DNA_ID=CAMNT_0049540957 /DNA_START=38 /DNA_END=899 /DNA_ORIENTATION=-